MRSVPRPLPSRSTPLDPIEEAAWRVIARAVLVVPRTLEADLLDGCGLSLAEYIVLVNLSEAPGRTLRMYELAVESTLTSGGVTRLVARMEKQGLLTRQHAVHDGRGMTATLTSAGSQRLSEAYPFALASVRTNVIDHLADLDLPAFTAAVSKFSAAGPRRDTRRRLTR